MKKIILATTVLALFLVGCVTSSAPGCSSGFGFGGCTAKSITKDVKIEPKVDCLDFYLNNCNEGGQVNIINNCKGQNVTIGGFEYGYYPEAWQPLEVSMNEKTGEIKVLDPRLINSYISGTEEEKILIPTSDTPVKVYGMVGTTPITVSFVRTPRLC